MGQPSEWTHTAATWSLDPIPKKGKGESMADGGRWSKAGFPLLAVKHLISSTIRSNPTLTGHQMWTKQPALKIFSSYMWNIMTDWQIWEYTHSYVTSWSGELLYTVFFISGNIFFYKIMSAPHAVFRVDIIYLNVNPVIRSSAELGPCKHNLNTLVLIKGL